MPNASDVDRMGVTIDSVENPVVVTEHFAMNAVLLWISWSDIRKRTQHFYVLNNRGADLQRSFYTLLFFAVIANYGLQIANCAISPNQLEVHWAKRRFT